MSIEERYAKAIRTSHLEVEEAPGDADMVIAAGMSESLGVMMARLRAEWDASAGEVALVTRNSKRIGEARAAAVEAAKQKDAKPFDVAAFDRDAERELLTARALILMNLRSLAPAKQSIFDFALKQSAGKGVTDGASKARAELQALTVKLGGAMSKEDRAQLIQDHSAKCREVSDLSAAHNQRIAALVGCVLDVWLDKLCHRCDGRGFTGGYGTPRIGCKHCRETGSRRQSQLSDRASEHQFGLWLLNVLDSKCNSSMAQVGRKTRQE